MATSLVHADTPLTFFHGLVEEALEHQRVRPLEETTFYLVTLLAGFVNPERPGAGLTDDPLAVRLASALRSEEHTSELQSHTEISYAVFCLKKKK